MKEKAIGKIIAGLLICLMFGLVFGGLIDTTSATSEKTTVSVIESSPWFTKGSISGHPELWYSHTYQGHNYISTYVGGMSGNPSQPDCWAEFKPYLSQSGKYEVYAYFYACKDTSTKVPFTVKYDGGSTTIKVNQYRSSPAWKEKYIGTWNFAAGSRTYVKVTDATGEPYDGCKGLTIGAIKFMKKETVPTPVISGIDPPQPTVSPTKQWISIIGTGFVSDSTVTLCIGSSTYPIPADRTEFKSSSQIRVYVGLTDPGTWTARVTNPGNRLSNLFSFTVKQGIPTPVITGIDPPQPTASPTRQWITIIGTGFVSDSTVTLRIGSSTYPIPADRTEFKSSTQIRVYVGLTDPGTWTARVTNPGNRLSNLFSFTVKQGIPTPVITGIDPPQPTASPTRQWITIIGTGFVSDSTVTLRIGSSTYPIPSDRTEFKSSTQIRVYVGLTDPGTWTAQITNPGNRLSNLFSFTVKQDIPTPAVTGIDPSQPTASPTRQWISIIGTGFVSDSTVTLCIGSSTYPIPADRTEYKSSSQIRVYVGLTDPGTWTARVTNQGNRLSNLFSFTVKQDIPTPAITGIDPSQPTASPTRQWITIIGTGFVSDSTVTLRIGSSTYPIPADRTEFKSSTKIRVYVGLTDPGTWSAQVTNPGNRLSNLFSFTVKQEIPSPVHDMAVTNVYTTPYSPNVSQTTTIYVTVKNEGNQQEKNVPVKAYVDGSQVGSTQHVTLSAGKSTTKSFTWTPSTAKTYSVKGEVGIVSGETDTSDNKKIIGVSVSPAPSAIPPITPSPQTGSIRVTTNLDIAFFTITGPETYQAFGKSWSISNAPAGLYTITYTEIPGYIIPSSETKTLSVGGSITFSGSYTKIGLYQLPATRGKISWFSSEESGNPGAWGEWLGENLGRDEATKYWYCAMRWPYYDPNTGFFDQAAKDWWQNKKILLTNPKNDKQVVLAAKDWGPIWWTGRVIDVSKTALDTLGVETDDIVNIKFADQNAELGPPPSTKFKTGDLIVTKKKWNLRSDMKIAEGSIKTTLDKGSEGEILENDDNGKFVPDNKYYWWYVKFGDYEGWCAEDGLEKSETVPKVAKPVISSPLEITAKDIYYVGDTLAAKFTITNRAAKSVTFDVLVIGGRDPTGEVVDFDKTYDVALNPGDCYDYEGYLTLPNKPGIYHFFCAYHTEEHMPCEDEYNWNTNIDVEINGKIVEDFSEAKKYRERDIIVFEETYISPAPSPVLWEEIHGPWEDKRSGVSQIAVHPNNPEVVYTAMKHYHYYWGYEGDELYKSTDGGDSWIPVNHGLPGLTLSEYYWPIRAIAIAPSNPDIIYVGTSDLNPYSSLLPSAKGIYKSTNGGSEWTPVGGPYTGKWIFKTYCSISSMVVDPIDPNTVYAGTVGGGIWRTTNGGESWEKIWDNLFPDKSLDVNALAISPANPNVIYAATYHFPPKNLYASGLAWEYDLIKSENGGDTFETVPHPEKGEFIQYKIDDIAVDNKNADIVYVIDERYKVYRSTTGGKNWLEASGVGGNDPLPFIQSVTGLAWFHRYGKTGSISIHPDHSNVIYASGEWGFKQVYFSSDSGENWFPCGDLKDKHVKEIVLASNADSRVIYAAAIEGLFKVDISEPALELVGPVVTPTPEPTNANAQSSIAWYDQEGMQIAKSQNTPAMIFFYSDRCPASAKLAEVFADTRVINMSKNFVPIVGSRGLDRQYGIRYVPTIVFTNSQGMEIHRIVGYQDADTLVNEMQYALMLSTTLDVPFFSQRDLAWRDKKLELSPYSIGEYGCALTSAAMVTKYFGYDTDPDRLNVSLTEVGGLDTSGILYWKKVEDVSDGKAEWVGWAEGNWSRIDQELSKKNPVIADVSCSLGNHCIIFIGKNETEYYHLDPYDETRTVNKWPNGAHGEYTLNNLRIYHRGRQQLVEAIEELELAIIDSIDYDVRHVADSYALLATAAELTPWWRELARLALDTIHAVVGTVIEVGEFLTPKGANQVLEDPSTCQQVISGVKDSKDILGGIATFQGLAGLYRNADSYKLSFEAINTVEEVARQEYEVSGDFDRTANAAWLELWRPSTPNGLLIPLKTGTPLKEGSRSSVSHWVNGLKEVREDVKNSFDDVINEIPDPLPADYPLAETITYLKNLKQQIRGGGYRIVKFKCVEDDKEIKRHITLGMVQEGREATSLLYDAWMDDLDVQYTSTLHNTGETIMHVTTYGFPATGVTKKVMKGVSDLYEVIDIIQLPSDLVNLIDKPVHPLDALQNHTVKMNNDLVHETSNLWALSEGTVKYLQYTWTP